MSAYIAAELRLQVRAQFAHCCVYCRTAEALTVVIFEVEHIVPRSAGGETLLENLCLACPTCNRYKAARQMVADPASGAMTPFFHPKRERWDAHFSWNDEYTEIIGLTAIGRATIAALKMNRPPLVRARSMWVRMGEHPPRSGE